MGAGRSCCAVTDARARAASARWEDCTCRASSRAARSWCVATTARPPAVSARPAPPAVRTGQCPPAPPAVRTGQCPPVPPAVRIGQCCYTRCQNGSVLLHPLSKQVSTAITRTGQYHPDPHAVRTGQYRCQNRSVPPPIHPLSEQVTTPHEPLAVRTDQCCSTRCQNRSVLLHPLSDQVSTAVRTVQYRCQKRLVTPCSSHCQNMSVPLMNHPLSEQVSAVPPAVRTAQCCSSHCQNSSVPLSEKVSNPLLHPLSEHVSTPHEQPAVRTGQ